MPVVVPGTPEEADRTLSSGSCVINFCATWCEPCAHMNSVFAELGEEHKALQFLQLDADEFPDLCDRFSLESVPHFVFLHNGQVVDTVVGANAPELSLKARQNALTASIHTDDTSAAAAGPKSLDERLQALTHQSPVVLFMKGSPDTPRCGFSRKIVELLQGEKVAFTSFDILGDEEVRQGLKAYSNWPTYPQLYADGKLLGGLDIVKELHEEGELRDSLPVAAIA